MGDADRLLQEAAKTPDDRTGRSALADLLRACEEHELALAVESDTGPELLRDTVRLGHQTKLPLSVKLLWCQYAVVPRVPPFIYPPDRFSGVNGIGHRTGEAIPPLPATPVDDLIDFRRFRPLGEPIRTGTVNQPWPEQWREAARIWGEATRRADGGTGSASEEER